MSDSVIQVIGYCALAVVGMWLVSLLVTYVRENAPTRPAKQPWRLEITHTHVHALDGTTSLQLRDIVQELKHTTMVHEVGVQTFDDCSRLLEAHLREYFDLVRRERENIPPAQEFVMPPEPEERIARDLNRAKAVLRGATQLQQAARMNGLTLSQEDAMRQAADMLHATLDADDPR